MEDKLEKLKSPLGEIIVMVDGHPIDYIAQKGSDNDDLWPDVIKCTLDTLFVQIIHVFRAVHRFLANFVAVLQPAILYVLTVRNDLF